MNTQPLGISKLSIEPYRLSHFFWREQLSFLRQYHYDVIITEAVNDYKKKMCIGKQTNVPAIPFPHDGMVLLETPSAPNVWLNKIRYVEGPGDAVWIEAIKRLNPTSVSSVLNTENFGLSEHGGIGIAEWEAINDYITSHGNANNSDNPARSIPLDGYFSWEYPISLSGPRYSCWNIPDDAKSKVIYNPGKEDRKWINERICNYLARLSRGDIRNDAEQRDAIEQRNHDAFINPKLATFSQLANFAAFHHTLPPTFEEFNTYSTAHQLPERFVIHTTEQNSSLAPS